MSRNKKIMLFVLVIVGYALSSLVTFAIVRYQTDKSTPYKADLYAVYNGVNKARADHNVPGLSMNPLLMQAAEMKCNDMVQNDYYDHVNPVTKMHGYSYSIDLLKTGTMFNENLNEGNALTNQGWVDSWMNSPDHRKTMLDGVFTDTGLAICHRPSQPENTYTIVQEFAKNS